MVSFRGISGWNTSSLSPYYYLFGVGCRQTHVGRALRQRGRLVAVDGRQVTVLKERGREFKAFVKEHPEHALSRPPDEALELQISSIVFEECFGVTDQEQHLAYQLSSIIVEECVGVTDQEQHSAYQVWTVTSNGITGCLL